MTIRNLDTIFRPSRVAILGASDRPGSVGGAVLRNMLGADFKGVVYPVNPNRESVHGVAAYRSVADLPNTPDLAVVCTPAPTVPDLIDACGERGVRGVLVISGGFREAGDSGNDLETELKRRAVRWPGMRILGPNCVGVIVPGARLNASFGPGMPAPGNLAFISQSGALCTATLDWALMREVGFSYFISIGNMLDAHFGDVIDYVAQDPATEAIILYVEAVTDARAFLSAARAFARSKPIVVYKAGRFAESAAAAKSHTGAMAGEDSVYDAAFRRSGVRRVYQLNDVFHCAELLARQRAPRGERLAILTNAGGPGVMSSDALIAATGRLAQLSDRTISRLDAILPPSWSRNNPVDMIGDAPAERYEQAARIVLDDPGVDALLAILAPQAMLDPADAARSVADVAQTTDKPVLASWMGGGIVRRASQILERAGVPAYSTPEQAVRAFMHLVEYQRNLDVLHETPREVPASFLIERRDHTETFRTALAEGRNLLPEHVSKSLLASYGIETTIAQPARSAEEAVRIAAELGYPVVLKVLSHQITHKTDVGGVVLDLRSDDEVRRAYADIVARARNARPDADVEGVTVQRLFTLDGGVEMIVGAKKDPTFGPVLMVGMGGVTAEIMKDRALELPPLNESLARRMLESLRSWPLLTGYRGRPPLDVDGLIEVLMRLSYLVADHPQIAELDANPILVRPDRVVALDARIVLDPAARETPRPYSHLAIAPYPDRFIETVDVAGVPGDEVTLRVARPEDEPLWRELIQSLDDDDRHTVLGGVPAPLSHWAAARACTVDYDRELTLVAETAESGGSPRRLLAAGRLVASPDRDSAALAVAVLPDAPPGLAKEISRFARRVADGWDVQAVREATAPEHRTPHHA